MLSPFLLTPQAWQDALEITEYIGTDNPEAAARLVKIVVSRILEG